MRHGQGAELALGETVLVHVALRPEGKIDRLRIEAARLLERLLCRVKVVKCVRTSGASSPVDSEVANDDFARPDAIACCASMGAQAIPAPPKEAEAAKQFEAPS